MVVVNYSKGTVGIIILLPTGRAYNNSRDLKKLLKKLSAHTKLKLDVIHLSQSTNKCDFMHKILIIKDLKIALFAHSSEHQKWKMSPLHLQSNSWQKCISILTCPDVRRKSDCRKTHLSVKAIKWQWKQCSLSSIVWPWGKQVVIPVSGDEVRSLSSLHSRKGMKRQHGFAYGELKVLPHCWNRHHNSFSILCPSQRKHSFGCR